MKQAWCHSAHSYANTDSNGTGETEDDIREDEVPDTEIGLDNIKTKTECHNSLVGYDCHCDGDQVSRSFLKSNSQALKDRM